MDRRAFLSAAVLATTFSGPAISAEPPVGLSTDLGERTEDLDGMLRRRLVRMLVPLSPTLFFQDHGTLYGTAAQGAQALEAWLNKTYKTNGPPVVVALVLTSRDKLLGDLLAGRGDIAAGDITVTATLAKQAAFTRPLLSGIKEILVSGPQAAKLAGAEDLSGKEVATREGTASHASLLALNEILVQAGKPPVKLISVPGTLEPEDMMEMVAVGLLPAMIADDWVANLWAGLISGLTLQPQVVLRQDVDIAWGVRQNNPKLLAALNTAIAQVGGSATQISGKTAGYLKRLKQIHAANTGDDVARFRSMLAMFQRYAGEYDFDDLLLIAQSYQESRLDQSARSGAGAIGLMQLELPTGQAMQVGDIHEAEANVHAGAKYMRQLVDKNFPDAHFDQQNCTLFAFASYNAGPGAIERMRKLAVTQQLNPNIWFNNVERVTAVKIGQEPVRYVRNIYKYYVAYKLMLDQEQQQEAAKKQVGAPR